MSIRPGLRVLITAGASGIGWVIARTMHRAGARVYICDAAPSALEEAERQIPEIGYSLADVTDAEQVDSLFADVEKTFEGLDILVNNAGIAGPTAAVEDISPSDWRRTLEVNIT